MTEHKKEFEVFCLKNKNAVTGYGIQGSTNAKNNIDIRINLANKD